MSIPNATNPKWKKLLAGEIKVDLKFLALKLLLGRLNMKYKKDPSDATTRESVKELVAFFEKNKNIPVATDDLTKIFG